MIRSVEQHYSPEQAAGLLGVSCRTVWRLMDSGAISRIRRVGRQRRIPASALQAYLDRNTLRAPAA